MNIMYAAEFTCVLDWKREKERERKNHENFFNLVIYFSWNANNMLFMVGFFSQKQKKLMDVKAKYLRPFSWPLQEWNAIQLNLSI